MARTASALPVHLALAYAGLVAYACLHPFTGWQGSGLAPFDFLLAPWPKYYEVDDIVLDRDRLLDERVLSILDVGQVRIEGRITAEAASRALGVPLELRGGAARVTVQGQTLDASISIAGRSVLLSVTGAPPLVVPLPPEKYLPCQPEVELTGDRLVVACSTTELPPAIMEVLGKGTG